MTKYKNDARAAQLDAELEAEELEYRKQFSGEVEEEQSTPLDTPAPLVANTPDEENWKKRHGDLRSYTSKLINEKDQLLSEKDDKIAELEREKDKLPTNKIEAENWVKEYPDLARVLGTLIETQTEYVKEDVKTVRQELEAERHSMAKEKAFNAVCQVHSDFPQLIQTQDFKDWVLKQPLSKAEGGRGRIGRAIHDALYENDLDAEAAIEAVDVYKSDMAAKTPKKDNTAREAAASVKRTSAATPSEHSDKRTFKESEIEKMRPWDYDKLEDEIETARREGRIVYDISGAAR